MAILHPQLQTNNFKHNKHETAIPHTGQAFSQGSITYRLCLSATSYLCMRAIFHELPFSINEDGLLLIKIFSAGFGTAFVIGIILYALNYIFKIIHAYIFSLRVFKFRRFFISKKESGAFMPA